MCVTAITSTKVGHYSLFEHFMFHLSVCFLRTHIYITNIVKQLPQMLNTTSVNAISVPNSASNITWPQKQEALLVQNFIMQPVPTTVL
jgi:hypothetical protein